MITGSIAEREHRKWSESAVAMPNNPYTQEKVWERKISRTQFNNFPVRKRYIEKREKRKIGTVCER